MHDIFLRRLRLGNILGLLLAMLVLAGHTTSAQDGATRAGVQATAGNKVVVLTFDDAVKSHRTFVAPLLKELGFGATFFVTHRWMADTGNFMTWEDIAEIHRLGFEIGNHSWTHGNFASPKEAARLPAELALVESELQKVKVPKPVSFAYSGNSFGPEAVEQLKALGYTLARRGMQPEVPYGKIEPGPLYDPNKHHPLLIPTSGDSYPGWTLEHFQRVVNQASPGKIVVLQFHGVPDVSHPWVHTPPELFREEMNYLKREGFQVIALRDLVRYLPKIPPADSLQTFRQSSQPAPRFPLPVEVEATRNDLDYWLKSMLQDHGYSLEEAAATSGLPVAEVEREAARRGLIGSASASSAKRQPNDAPIRVLPYPGGRHPRIGFKDGAILPQRGTKASVFLPWESSGYAVVDVPEAIFSNLGLTYLAHTHIPSIWDVQNLWLDNLDWKREANGLSNSRTLPNQVAFGVRLTPSGRAVEMELWLKNDSAQDLTGLRVQVCVMLKGAPEFNRQTNDNKRLKAPIAVVRSEKGNRWILTAWERCGRVWGNAPCPCMHSDPVLPDCPAGQTVRVRGKLWFYDGKQIEEEIDRQSKLFAMASPR
jgi:peptidoglycan/xylan/chitin deacetylase (PgdA/CDA1 family)